jgi:hypothetical protein
LAGDFAGSISEKGSPWTREIETISKIENDKNP